MLVRGCQAADALRLNSLLTTRQVILSRTRVWGQLRYNPLLTSARAPPSTRILQLIRINLWICLITIHIRKRNYDCRRLLTGSRWRRFIRITSWGKFSRLLSGISSRQSVDINPPESIINSQRKTSILWLFMKCKSRHFCRIFTKQSLTISPFAISNPEKWLRFKEPKPSQTSMIKFFTARPMLRRSQNSQAQCRRIKRNATPWKLIFWRLIVRIRIESETICSL